MNKKATKNTPKKTGRPRINDKNINEVNNPKSKKGGKVEFLKALSLRSGVDLRHLYRFAEDGCDLSTDDAVRAYLDTLPIRPSTVKESFYTPPTSASNNQTTQVNVDDLKRDLLQTKDKIEASRIKAQIDGLLVAQRLEVLSGKHIAIGDVEAAFAKIGASVRSMVIRMEADLPPALYGMTAAQMSKKVREYTTKILKELSEGKKNLLKAEVKIED